MTFTATSGRALTIAALATIAAASQAGVVGQWEFNGDLKDAGNGTYGAHDLKYVGANLSYETFTLNGQTGTAARFGDGAADGAATTSEGISDYFEVTNPVGLSPKTNVFDVGGTSGAWGSENQTYDYTLIMDVKWDGAYDWTTIYDSNNISNSAWVSDGEGFIAGDGSIGTIGYSDPGAYTFGQWARIAIVAELGNRMDHHNDGKQLMFYVNGQLVKSLTAADSWNGTSNYWGEVWPNRWGLKETFRMFSDRGQYGNEGLVGSLMFRDDVLSAADIAAYGGPSAAGISTVPEPATMVALGAGVLAMIAKKRRK